MRRKGGMELSINAIVILIIAMVVLGIGILFIRGMFAKAQVTTFKALTSQDTANPASADRPFITDREVTMSPSSPSASMQVSVYNIFTDSASVKITLSSCKSANGTDVTGDIGFASVDGSIPANQFSGYQTVISLLDSGNFAAGDVIACNLNSDVTSATGTIKSYPASVIVKIEAS